MGMSEGPGDFLSSKESTIVITSFILVGLNLKFVDTRFRKKDDGDIGVLGILLSTSGPTLAKKLLKVSTIFLESQSHIKIRMFAKN